MSQSAEDAAAEFKPGWPDLLPIGLIIAGSRVTQRRPPDDAPPDPADEDDVRWVLHLGVSDEAPRLALLGDLTVRNRIGFAGVTVVMPIALRDEPEEISREYTDDLLRQYGGWASSLMYDHAGLALRAALAGSGLPLDVPFGTPEAVLHTSDYHDEANGTEAHPARHGEPE